MSYDKKKLLTLAGNSHFGSLDPGCLIAIAYWLNFKLCIYLNTNDRSTGKIMRLTFVTYENNGLHYADIILIIKVKAVI